MVKKKRKSKKLKIDVAEIRIEASFYADRENGETLLDRQAAWAEYCHLVRPFGRDSLYHERLMRTLRSGLKLPDDRAVLECTYFTEVVKCSSPINEQQKISREHRRRCISVSLRDEINALPDVAILTLGREAEESVREAFPSRNVAYFHHPSYSKPSSEADTIRWLQEMAPPKLRVE